MSNARTAYSSELLRGKLAAVRSKQLFVALGTGVSWLVLVASVLLAGGMLIDWKYDLTRDVRVLFLMVDAVVLVTIFLRHIYTPLSNQLDDDEVALEVEKATPEFRSRLIAATQFGVGEKTDAAIGKAGLGQARDVVVQPHERIGEGRGHEVLVPQAGGQDRVGSAGQIVEAVVHAQRYGLFPLLETRQDLIGNVARCGLVGQANGLLGRPAAGQIVDVVPQGVAGRHRQIVEPVASHELVAAVVVAVARGVPDGVALGAADDEARVTTEVDVD